MLPILYLLSSWVVDGDFRAALPVLLGDDAAGLSATNIARLTAVWDEDYRQLRQRDLADRDYVYVRVDGIHFNIRLEDDRLCTLVMIGVRPMGRRRSSHLRTATEKVPTAGRRSFGTYSGAGCRRR